MGMMGFSFIATLLISVTASAAQVDASAWKMSPSDSSRIRCAKEDTNPLKCLTCNAFFEANIEGSEGLRGVSYTVFNRASSKSYPTDICKVVYQKKQFSWANSGAKTMSARDFNRVQQQTLEHMNDFFEGKLRPGPASCATHYVNLSIGYAERNSAKWRSELHRLGKIKQHTFFKMRGHQCYSGKGKAKNYLVEQTLQRSARSERRSPAQSPSGER